MATLEADSAATTFANKPKLITDLAEQFWSPRKLGKLRLVNKLFCEVVTPVLFRHVYIRQKDRINVHPDLNKLLKSGILQHIRKLSFKGQVHDAKTFNKNVRNNILRSVPHLTHFIWLVGGLEMQTLYTLHRRCPKLTTLIIEINGPMFEELHVPLFLKHRRAQFEEFERKLELPAFRNLQTLSIFKLKYINLKQLVKLLQNNATTLRSLTISEADHMSPYGYLGGRGRLQAARLPYEFLSSLYRAYGEANSDGQISPPLALHSLTLGTRYYPGAGTDLATLVDLRNMREIHIKTKLSYWSIDGDYRFMLFGPDTCPNLRFYGIGDMIHEAFKFLAKADPEWMRRLAVVPLCVRQDADHNLIELMRPIAEDRPPLRVRMMALELSGYSASRTDEILADLVAFDDGTLEGLRVLMGGDENWEFDNLDSVLEALGKLKGLRQLILHQRWRSSTRNILLGVVAHKAAMAIPTLQFIHIPDKSWQVHRTRVDGGESYDVQLEPLDKFEEVNIEIFRVPVVDG